MHPIAPEVKRQRLLIEGYFSKDVSESIIREYFKTITQDLNLKSYGEPIIFSPESLGKEDNQGYDAFIPLIDSGISLYVWTQKRFLSIIIYTCKDFPEEKALETTLEFFLMGENVSSSF